MDVAADLGGLLTVPDAMLELVGRQTQAFATAIYAEHEGRRGIEGSGVLLKVGHEHFLVTAGHVVDVMRDPPRGARFRGYNFSNGQLVPLDGIDMRSVDKGARDVGILALPRDFAESLGGSANYLELDRLDSRDHTRKDTWHLVCGFPSERYNAPAAKTQLVRYLTRSRTDYHRRAHAIVLNYRPASLKGQQWELTDMSPKGMSGGGIWRIYGHSSSPLWKPDDLRLVGIQYSCAEVSGAKLLRGTRILCVLQLIADMKPELGKLIHQYDPRVLPRH